MALTGVAIGITGGGVSIAFAIAIVTVFISSLPMAAIGSAMPAVGGMYTYTARLIHPLAGYGSLFVSFLAQSSLGLFGITAGQYMHSLNPAFNETVVAVVLIVGFYLANTACAAFGSRAGIVMSFS